MSKLRVLRIQSLMDKGYHLKKIARRLNTHHQTISRIIDRHELEWYVPYDEAPALERCALSEWECEDILDEIITEAFNEGEYLLIPLSVSNLSNYLKERYGSLRGYIQTKEYGELLEHLILKECTKCFENKPLIEYSCKDTAIGYYTQCKECCVEGFRKWQKENPDVFKYRLKENNHIRRALESNLPSVRGYKTRHGCVLTSSEDTHLDHFIPIAIGHGGTYASNMISLKSELNINKSDENPFTWFETNRQRFKLDQSRFDAVVADLANQNGLTPDEYRQYVDWCFENKRSLDEIIADNKRYGYVVTSVELWRDSTGMQLPLRFDNREQTFVIDKAA